MRRAPAGLLLISLLGLSGCSLWPWHHRHLVAAQDTAVAPAGTTSAATPVQSATAASSPASPAVPPVAAAPTGGDAADDAASYAPFTAEEWRRLWDAYRPLAQCTDHYMASAGINGQLLGVTLVQLKKDAQVIGEARKLLGAALPPLPDTAPVNARAELASQAVWLLMQDQPRLGLGQVLARKALARYDLSLVAGPACPLDSGYHSLLAKALH